MTTQQLERAQLPDWWPGSVPEYICYTTLMKLGKQPDIDFTYQSQRSGGRLEKGGRVLDFQFINPPDLAINIQGTYYHYEKGTAVSQSDVLTREFMATEGITLIFIDEDDLHVSPESVVKDALRYIDRSRLGGRA
jgi:hypothetical protein